MNWYYRLVSKGDDDRDCANSYYRDGDFLVCKQVPSTTDPDIPMRKFGVFNDPISFISHYGNPQKQRCYYEVIKSNVNQKPYFDIDMSPENMKNAGIALKDHATIPLAVIESILKTYPQIKRENILVYNAHSNDPNKPKFSYHILVNGWYVQSAAQNQVFFNKIMKDLPNFFEKVVDTSLFKENQQFRVLGSHKFNSPRTKLPDNMGRLNSTNSSEIMLESFVTATDKCSRIIDEAFDGVTDRTTKSIHSKLPKIVFDHKNKDILRLLRPFAETFNIYPTANGYSLRRTMPAECIICKREHENENAAIEITSLGVMYYKCFRDLTEKKFIAFLTPYEISDESVSISVPENLKKPAKKTLMHHNSKADRAAEKFSALL